MRALVRRIIAAGLLQTPARWLQAGCDTERWIQTEVGLRQSKRGKV